MCVTLIQLYVIIPELDNGQILGRMKVYRQTFVSINAIDEIKQNPDRRFRIDFEFRFQKLALRFITRIPLKAPELSFKLKVIFIDMVCMQDLLGNVPACYCIPIFIYKK